MKSVRSGLLYLLLFSALHLTSGVFADEIYKVELYFGLSRPDGGSVSEKEWGHFEKTAISTVFDGYNVVESRGWYKGQKERSKVATIITKKNGIQKAKALAKLYAEQFKQESVMLVVLPVLEWTFISKD